MNEIVLIIGILCKTNVTNVVMPKEEKISCVEFFANCLVGPNGIYLKKERANCEQKYENNKRNRGNND